jgi:hypothetical protein
MTQQKKTLQKNGVRSEESVIGKRDVCVDKRLEI